MGRYRFLLRPRWLVISFVVALVAFTMVNLGLWQLRRLDEKRTHNQLLDARAAEEVVTIGGAGAPAPPIGAQLDVGVDGERDDLAYRTGVAQGTYQPDEEVLVRSRTLEGDPGAWVLTPLRLADGHGALGCGRLPTLARADLQRLQAQVEAPLYPLYLQLQAQDPPPGDVPVLLPAPERSEGPHLGYAVQWFLFTVIGLVSYGLLVRRTAREQTRDRQVDEQVLDRRAAVRADLETAVAAGASANGAVPHPAATEHH